MTPWSVDSPQFGQFLNAVFDARIREDIGDNGIQLFEQTLAVRCGLPPQVLRLLPPARASDGNNGDVYNWRSPAYPQFKLGNTIHQKTLRQMNQGEQNRQFGSDKQHLHGAGVPSSVNGSSPAMAAVRKHRRFYPPRQAQPITTICAGYQAFFLAYRDGDECHANPV